MVVGLLRLVAAHADLKNVVAVFSLLMALWKFENDAALSAEILDGGVGIVDLVMSQHFAELGVGLELFEMVIGDRHPTVATAFVVEFIEVEGEIPGHSWLANEAGDSMAIERVARSRTRFWSDKLRCTSQSLKARSTRGGVFMVWKLGKENESGFASVAVGYALTAEFFSCHSW